MDIKTELEKVYNDGLNIYALINRIKKARGWEKGREFPEEVLLGVCSQYFRQKQDIKNAWTWFLKVLDAECSTYYAKQIIAEHDKVKTFRMPEAIRNIMRGL